MTNFGLHKTKKSLLAKEIILGQVRLINICMQKNSHLIKIISINKHLLLNEFIV